MIRRLVVGATGVALLLYALGLVMGAGAFPRPTSAAPERQVMLLVVATCGAALLHVVSCIVSHKSPPRLFWVLTVAGLARLILVFGSPTAMLEGDHARIRFDGRMVNQGLNPYEFKPEQLQDDGHAHIATMTGPERERLRLARAAMTASVDAPRPDQVARPDLRSTSTPLALWLGSIGDRFKPQSTRGFAFLVLVADVLAIYLLIIALRGFGLPLAWVMVYAWSPILLKEAYCTLAPDAFLMPVLAGLVCCIACGRRLLAAVPLALAGAIRFPFLLLMPLFARRIGFLGVILAGLLFIGPFLPFTTPSLPAGHYVEGQIHVWRHYEYQSLVENVLRGGLRSLPNEAENSLEVAGVPIIQPGELVYPLLAKVLCILLLLGAMVYLIIRLTPEPEEDAEELDAEVDLVNLFSILVVMLAVSPVLHPWLAIWLLPVLCIRRFGIAWLMLPGLVTLSHLTHLVGPQAADIVFLGGHVSIRVLMFGLFVGLLLIDRAYAAKLFAAPPKPKRALPDSVSFTEEDLMHDFVLAEEPVRNF